MSLGGGLNINKMDMTLTFEQQTTTRNSIGDDISSWTKYKTVRAERMRRPGGETITANQQVASMPTDYKVRHDSNINQTMRCFEGVDTGTNPRYYLRDVQHWKREGYTQISAERRDNV